MELTALQAKKIQGHLELLERWGKVFNLTAITNRNDMMKKHVEDALSLVPYLRGVHILDVGSGAGFPGVPLAIMFPEKQITLLDSNGKKTRFLVQVKAELALTNVQVLNERVENVRVEMPFDTIVCRAFASLEHFYATTQHLANTKTRFIAMKGRVDALELQALIKFIPQPEIIRLSQPDVGERHLVVWSGISG